MSAPCSDSATISFSPAAAEIDPDKQAFHTPHGDAGLDTPTEPRPRNRAWGPVEEVSQQDLLRPEGLHAIVHRATLTGNSHSSSHDCCGPNTAGAAPSWEQGADLFLPGRAGAALVPLADGQALDIDARSYNMLLRALRCLGERGFAFTSASSDGEHCVPPDILVAVPACSPSPIELRAMRTDQQQATLSSVKT
ncbi:hypothetical protein OG417_32990 [Actinoallomurus sp. NBC_01490]|uniref:hypothetical protein n=1 Tax=Actinoallomurus sp. NBC_01490 TaxID=2903557 RepID=UPI002E345CA6|nr:hypothetical protein [Actinoallomurus sp. NBC_01490]